MVTQKNKTIICLFQHFDTITWVNEMSCACAWNKYNNIMYMYIKQSPALQIPVFIYFAMDLRKIIEGSDPALAQKLVESNFLWLTDLTEPDPWYGLPIATGVLLYMNVEVSFANLFEVSYKQTYLKSNVTGKNLLINVDKCYISCPCL